MRGATAGEREAAPVDDEGDSAFDCPRCGAATTARFYGPCASCRDELRARHVGESRHVEAPEYEPPVNVVPNQVATKE